MAAGVLAGFALDRHRFLRKDRRGVEERAVVLAAVQAVAHPNAIRLAVGFEAHLAAQAAAAVVLFCQVFRQPSKGLLRY